MNIVLLRYEGSAHDQSHVEMLRGGCADRYDISLRGDAPSPAVPWSAGVQACPVLRSENFLTLTRCLCTIYVISWNVRGLNSTIKRSLVFNYLKKYSPQLVVLQETHLVGSWILGLKKAWVGAHYHATYSSYSRGVSILVHKKLPFPLIDLKTDSEGRFIIMHALVSNAPLVLVGLYLPPPADISVFNTVMQHVLTYGVDDVLFIGDFNMTPSPDLDRLPYTSRGPLVWPYGWACSAQCVSGVTIILKTEVSPVTQHPSGHSCTLIWPCPPAP